MKTFVLLATFLAVSCGGKSSSTTTPTGGGSGSDTGVAATKPLPDVPFDSLDHEQRIQFMKEVVVPTMEPLFKGHDAKKFAEFGCKTCHGASAEQGKFDMPNEALPKLFGPSMPKFKKEDVEWMGKEIKPTMAKLLKQTEYSEANPKGFGCLECHTMEPK
jgi:hypothetical protein